MFKKNISGQFVYFGMVSALSGNAVYSGSPISLSGKISGYVAIDGAAQAAVGGNIVEDSFGQYHLNGFAADFNGNNLGFLFVTSSGVVPVNICVVTVGGISGAMWIGSGQSTLVYSGQLSGQPINLLSGSIFKTTYASGVIGTSGGLVRLGGGSGSVLTDGSGRIYSIVLDNQDKSGYTISFNLDKTEYTIVSGTAFLASGSIFKTTFASGVIGTSGGLVRLGAGSGSIQPDGSGRIYSIVLDNQDKSGYVIGINLDKSGYVCDVQSGTTFLAPASIFKATYASGVIGTSGGLVRLGIGSGSIQPDGSGRVFSIVLQNTDKSGYVVGEVLDKSGYTSEILSGTAYLASGSIFKTTFASGVIGTSGGLPRLGAGSGSVLTDGSGRVFSIVVTNLDKTDYSLLSGTTWLTSGHEAALYSGSIFRETFASGVIGLSGGLPRLGIGSGSIQPDGSGRVFANVVVNQDKTNYEVTSGTTWLASGHPTTLYSGQTVQLYSGQSTLLYSGQFSGQPVSVTDKLGYVLASSGLDAISTTAPTTVAANFREMVTQTWRRLFKKTTLTASELKTFADNNTTVITTQAVSDNGTVQDQGAAT